MNVKYVRTAIAGVALTAAGLVHIANRETYVGEAMLPTPNDVPTLGYGSTAGVKMGDKTTPERALIRLLADADEAAKAVKRCVTVPLYPYEFDAYVSFTHNLGAGNFCGSTMVRKLNAGDYAGACAEFTQACGVLPNGTKHCNGWTYQGNTQLRGLVKFRAIERQMCEGKL